MRSEQLLTEIIVDWCPDLIADYKYRWSERKQEDYLSQIYTVFGK